MLNNEMLFGVALGIENPLYIEKVMFDKEAGELHIHINFVKGSKFKCSVCGRDGLPVYDTEEKIWRHLNFFQYKCFLHFRTPRSNCPEHGVHLINVPWANKSSGFTMLFEALVMCLAKEMPISAIADMVDEHDTRIWRIIRSYVTKAYTEQSFEEVRSIGVDETSSKKGHNYISIFADMINGKVIYATEGKDSNTIANFADELLRHDAKPEQISEVSMDMSPAFISGVNNDLPKASVTFDKFHVIKKLNEALDEVRREEQKTNPLLRRSRYVWLKNPGNLRKSESEKLESLSHANLKTGKVYRMKLIFQDIYNTQKNQVAAEVAIKQWLSWASRSRIEPVKEFARLVKSHYKGILHYFESGLTNGVIEGINSRIQEAKRRAKGYRNIKNFITMVYLEAGQLNFT